MRARSRIVHFHLPKSKAAELKTHTTPPSPSVVPCISTYDACTAYLWRTPTTLMPPAPVLTARYQEPAHSGSPLVGIARVALV